MNELPSNIPDPQPGDFTPSWRRSPRRTWSSSGWLRRRDLIEVLVEGEDARRLAGIASERGQRPGEVVAELSETPESRRRSLARTPKPRRSHP